MLRRSSGEYGGAPDTKYVNCYVYNNRKLVLVNTPAGVNGTTQGFYYSTDTSNQYGFESYFPFYGMGDDGWIMKGRSSGFVGRGGYITDWREALCDILSLGEGTDENCKSVVPNITFQHSDSDHWETRPLERCCDMFRNFLDKFTDWWEVRISAALGSPMWNRPDYAYLKHLALNYIWVPKIQYLPADHLFQTSQYDLIDQIHASVPETPPGYFGENPFPVIAETYHDCKQENSAVEINEWMRLGNARNFASTLTNTVYLTEPLGGGAEDMDL